MIKKTNILPILSFLGFAFIFLPFFVLGAFNHPAVDDYFYSNKALEFGFLPAQFWWYESWCGRYVATALLSIDPLVVRSFFLYKFVPLALFLGLFHSLYTLIRALTQGYMNQSKAVLGSLLLLALFVGKMPSVVQGFYWYAGAVTYETANILMVYLLTCLIYFYRSTDTKRVVYASLSTILAIGVVGCNETSMVLIVGLLFFLILGKLYTLRKIDGTLVFLFILSAIGAYIVIHSPGNSVRMAQDYPQKQSLLFAIKTCIINDISCVFRWGVTLPMVGCTLLSIPFFAKIAMQRIKNTNHLFIQPVLSLGTYISIFTLGFFPAFLCIGDMPPDRTINLMYYWFLLGWFFNIYILVEYFIRKKGITIAPMPLYMVVILSLVVFLSFMKEDSNVRKAYIDLLSGRALRYDEQLKNRYQQLEECTADVCEINALQKPPETIFFDDITTKVDDWTNTSYAEYFHKKAVILIK